jgi:hypothetical protein
MSGRSRQHAIETCAGRSANTKRDMRLRSANTIARHAPDGPPTRYRDNAPDGPPTRYGDIRHRARSRLGPEFGKRLSGPEPLSPARPRRASGGRLPAARRRFDELLAADGRHPRGMGAVSSSASRRSGRQAARRSRGAPSRSCWRAGIAFNVSRRSRRPGRRPAARPSAVILRPRWRELEAGWRSGQG